MTARISPPLLGSLGGVAFSLRLIPVVIAGAGLFTGNNLLVTAWVSRHINTAKLLRNFAGVFVASFIIDALGLALLAA